MLRKVKRSVLKKKTKPMVLPQPRILMVLDQFNVGGTETYVLSLIRELIKKEAHVVVVGKRGKLLDTFCGVGCPIYEIDFVLDNHLLNQEKSEFHIEILNSLMEYEKINIVHAHQIPSGRLAKIAAENRKVPFLFSVHGTYYDTDFLEILKHRTHVISVSPAVQRMLDMNGVNSIVVPNGINLMEFGQCHPSIRRNFRFKLGIPEHAVVAMYGGRLSWEKSEICEDVISAYISDQLPSEREPHLLIVGGGKRKDEIHRLAESAHVQTTNRRIHLLGEVSNMRMYYAVSDCVIGTGRIALEALACGSPFIAVGSKGFMGLLTPERYEKAWDSWFADHESNIPWSHTLLAMEMNQVFNMSSAERERLKTSGRRWVAEKFNVEKTVGKILDIYRKTLGKTS